MGITEKIKSAKYSNGDQNEFLEFPKNPIHYSACENVDIKEPPLLGEHTDSILSELLGYSKEKIE